jgi:hypothetical protein
MVKVRQITTTATAAVEATEARGESKSLTVIVAAAIGSRFRLGPDFGSIECLGRQTCSRTIDFSFGSGVTAASLVGRFKVAHFVAAATGMMQAAIAGAAEFAGAVGKCCIDRISCRSLK